MKKPILAVYNAAGQLIAGNQGWTHGSSDDIAAVASASSKVQAFSLAPEGADSALVLTVDPGAYTVQVLDADSSSGNVLLEVYQVPQ